MPQTENLTGRNQKARVYPRQAGLYPSLNRDRWYRVRPGGPDEKGWCWLAGYGVRLRVQMSDFEFRKAG